MPWPSPSRSYRLIKEGLDRLLWNYWLAFKEKAWEVFWGPTLLGVAFGIYTLWYSPARPWFLAYVLIIVFLTGYYLWRPYHLRLIPKVMVEKPFIQPTPTSATWPDGKVTKWESIYVQLILKCDVDIYECLGFLKRVDRFIDGEWINTGLNEPMPLEWSYGTDVPITLRAGAENRLNIFTVHDTNHAYTPCVPKGIPLRAVDAFSVLATQKPYLFTVVITGKDCPPVTVNLKVTSSGAWNKPELEMTRE
jgi:hypothetical protein